MRICLLLVLTLTGCSRPTEPSLRNSPSGLAETDPKTAVTILRISTPRGEAAPAAAFRIGPGVLATAFAPLRGARSVTARSLTGLCQVSGVIAHDPNAGWVLLSAPGCAGPALARGSAFLSAPGDPIRVIGAPGGLEGTTASGVVSAWRLEGGSRRLQHDARTASGFEGSPVVNRAGQAIAVHTGTRGGFGIAVPIDLLPNPATANAAITIGEFGQRYPGLIARDRLETMLAQDAEDLKSLLKSWEDLRNSLPFWSPPNRRKAFRAEIASLQCAEAPALPASMLRLWAAEDALAEAIAAIQAEQRAMSAWAMRHLGKDVDPEEMRDQRRRLGQVHVNAAEALETAAEAERAVAAQSRREVVTDREPDLGADTRHIGALLIQFAQEGRP